MYTDKNITTWYGKVLTADGSFFVIYDKRITSDDKSKIYMFHSKRKELVLFMEDIVKDKLQELSDDELIVAKNECDQIWGMLISKHLKHQESYFTSGKKTTKNPDSSLDEIDNGDPDDDSDSGFEGNDED
jgi:hypothetical protein